jgi:superfamily II DNA/RNA helicase
MNLLKVQQTHKMISQHLFRRASSSIFNSNTSSRIFIPSTTTSSFLHSSFDLNVLKRTYATSTTTVARKSPRIRVQSISKQASPTSIEPKQQPAQVYKTRIKDSLTVKTPDTKKHDVSQLEEEKDEFFNQWFQSHPKIIECLEKEFKITKPSHIQQLAIPELMKGNDVLSAAQTGTGKTLSYVVPLLARMKNDEIVNAIETRKNRPRFIIIVPSRELAGQVASVVKKFSHYLKFRCVCLRSDLALARLKRDLTSDVDVIVSTPGIFQKLHEQKKLFYTDVRYVVVDEADTLLSKDFKQQLTDEILLPIKAREEHNDQKVQFCFVLATFNNEVQNYLQEHFPRAKLITAPRLHYNLKNITQRFVTIAGSDKLKHLLPLIGGETSNNRTIIFCNTVNSCRAVHYALIESGISASCYHSEIPPEKQAEEFDNFAKGEVHTMVCTDIASRGLDIPNIRHVIMFDFPLNTVDYLHRVGRTGRMGAPGKVTSFANRPREIALAQAIERTISTGTSLEGIFSTSKKIIAKEQKKKSLENKNLGKRALYWQRMKMKQDVQSAKSRSTGRFMNTISEKRPDRVVDKITIKNPSTKPRTPK